jgi:hypothetical protein
MVVESSSLGKHRSNIEFSAKPRHYIVPQLFVRVTYPGIWEILSLLHFEVLRCGTCGCESEKGEQKGEAGRTHYGFLKGLQKLEGSNAFLDAYEA